MMILLPQNLVLVVSIILIVPVSIVQKEDDMKKVLLDSVGPGREEANTLKLAYFDTYKSPRSKREDGLFGFMNAAFKRTTKYACYVREAINDNLECSLQCLKYLYKCENFLEDS